MSACLKIREVIENPRVKKGLFKLQLRSYEQHPVELMFWFPTETEAKQWLHKPETKKKLGRWLLGHDYEYEIAS